MLSEGFYDKLFSSLSHQAEYISSSHQRESPDPICTPPNQMTIAEYTAFELHKNQIHAVYSTEKAIRSSLFLACAQLPFSVQSTFQRARQAIYAAVAHAKNSGVTVLIFDEKELLSIIEELLQAIDDLVPLIIFTTRTDFDERSSVLGFPNSAKLKILQRVKSSLESIVGHYGLIDDRRTAGARIDRAVDISIEMKLPVFLETHEEVLVSHMPPHTYRRTIFNHEEHDLFYGAWETITLRLSRANAPLIVIGKQMRDERWITLLFQLSLRWNCELLVDEEIRGFLPVQLLEKASLIPTSGTQIDFEFDTVLTFGVESNNQWLMNLIEVTYFNENTHIEIFGVNNSSLFFGDGKDPFYIFCLEEFFQASSNFFKDFYKKDLSIEYIVDNKKKNKHYIHNSSVDPLYHMNYTIPHATPLFIAKVAGDIPRITKTLISTKIFRPPTNAQIDEWLFASLEGCIDSDKNQIVACATSSIELVESLILYAHRRNAEKKGHHTRILIILFTAIDTALLPKTISGTLFRCLGDLKEWVLRIPGEHSPHIVHDIGIIPIPPLYI